MILFHSEHITFNILNKRFLKKWINNTVELYNYQLGDLNIIFTNDQYLFEMNKKYLNHNYFTDVITFNYNNNNIISGDIFISIDRVKENSLKYSKSFIEELMRVIIHGVLHLIGFDDHTEIEQKIMRDKENISLNNLLKYNLKW